MDVQSNTWTYLLKMNIRKRRKAESRFVKILIILVELFLYGVSCYQKTHQNLHHLAKIKTKAQKLQAVNLLADKKVIKDLVALF